MPQLRKALFVEENYLTPEAYIADIPDLLAKEAGHNYHVKE